MTTVILENTTSFDSCWQSVLTRDRTADGSFVYAVKTTGIFCAPSCPSRRAKPENVLFFSTCEDAIAAGFRPCQRCKPDKPLPNQQHQELIVRLCRFIAESEQEPSLTELSERAQMSAYHLQRLFKRATGLTPKEYARAHRINRLQKSLKQSESITQAAFNAGYNSNSQFYAESQQVLGMNPKKYKAGGKDMNIYFAIGECSLGSVLVAQSEHGICAITLGDDAAHLLNELQTQFPNANLLGGDSNYEAMVAQVIGFIEKPAPVFNFPLDIRGTLFQQQVWRALQTIRPGETLSYSQLAERIGAPKAVRAVASACARNVLAVAIPCHRIVRNNGDLSGYRWGVERKQKLLEMENVSSKEK